MGASPITEEKARAILRDTQPCEHCGRLLSVTSIAATHGVSNSVVTKLVSGEHRFSNVSLEDR